MRKIPREHEKGLVQEYVAGRNTPELAGRYGVTRQAICALLKRNGVDRIERKVPVTCGYCGKRMLRFRSRANGRSAYCGRRCYSKQLGTSGYQEHRHSSRLARARVSEVFLLLPGQVVHHRDGNQRNNKLSNLMVFASQADHMRWHRGGGIKSGVVPVWPI